MTRPTSNKHTSGAGRAKGTRALANAEVRPVTNDNWEDFERFFNQRGSPHFCWCTAYRLIASELTNPEKKAAIYEIVTSQTPVGVLAYVEGRGSRQSKISKGLS